MIFYLFFGIFAVVVVALFFYYRKLIKEVGITSITKFHFLIPAIALTCLLYIPWYIYTWSPVDTPFGNFLFGIPYMVVQLMQTVSLDADYDTAVEIIDLAQKESINATFLKVYAGVLSWLSVSIPFLGIWTVADLFKNQINCFFIKNGLYGNKLLYVFNGVGNRSVDLATSIRESEKGTDKKSVILFCNVNEDPDEEIKKEIRTIKGYYTKISPVSLLKTVRPDKAVNDADQKEENKEKIRYFFMEEEEDNVNDAIAVLEEAGKNTDGNGLYKAAQYVRIDIMMHNNKLDNIMDAQKKYGIHVRILDAERMFVQELFVKWPMFICLNEESSGKSKDINLMIIGNGDVAWDVVMNAVWMGQIKDTSLKICYIGEDADLVSRKMHVLYPALFDPDKAGGEKYEIRFENDLDKFMNNDKIKAEEKDILKTNYVIVAGNDDEDNIQTAMLFKTWFARNTDVKSPQPFMALYISDEKRADQAEQLCVQESGIKYEFHVFGTGQRVFSAQNLLDSKLEKSIYRTQLCYNGVSDYSNVSREVATDVWSQLNEHVYNYRSSEAAAIYIVNRLYDAGALRDAMLEDPDLKPEEKSNPTGYNQAKYWAEALRRNEMEDNRDRLDRIISKYETSLESDKMTDDLSIMEHRRWIAYMASNGWVKMTTTQRNELNEKLKPNKEKKVKELREELDRLEKELALNDSDEQRNKVESQKKKLEKAIKKIEHKDYLRLWHSCMVPWEELDQLSKDTNNEKGSFKIYDTNIVKGVKNFIV